MASTTERIKQGFSETRTIILGAQILLGFQYQALFQPQYTSLPSWAKTSGAAGYALLALSMACMIAPVTFHRLAEKGRATTRECRYLDRMILASLVPFALALGAEISVATSLHIGTSAGVAVGVAATTIALFLWLGLETIVRRKRPAPRASEMKDENMALKDRINELLEQSRIVLPGVQALLGFQLVGYLSSSFAQLPAASKAAHTAALLLLVLAMVLLMMPTPYHRLAERGEDTESFDRIGSGLVLSALVPLALAIGADFYIVLQKVTENQSLAVSGAVVTVVVALAMWFAVPLAFRGKSRAPSPKPARAAQATTATSPKRRS